MLEWLSRKKPQQADALPPFKYGESLTLEWDEDCEGWTSALPELGNRAKIYIAPRVVAEQPQPESCELIVQARRQLLLLNDAALIYLVKESADFVRDAYKHHLSSASFTSTGIEIFEYGDAPVAYALTYDPTFDPGAIWRVHFEHQQPVEWGFDD